MGQLVSELYRSPKTTKSSKAPGVITDLPPKPKYENPYFSKFKRLNCQDDVLAAIMPVPKLGRKISEAMAVIKLLKPIVMRDPGKYTIIEVGSGTPITAIIAAHLLPIKNAIAGDKIVKDREYQRVKDLTYLSEQDVQSGVSILKQKADTILISVHPSSSMCETLLDSASRSDGGNGDKIHYSIIMPGFNGKIEPGYKSDIPNWVQRKIGHYDNWVLYLQKVYGGKVVKDNNIKSHMNSIIVNSY